MSLALIALSIGIVLAGVVGVLYVRAELDALRCDECVKIARDARQIGDQRVCDECWDEFDGSEAVECVKQGCSA